MVLKFLLVSRAFVKALDKMTLQVTLLERNIRLGLSQTLKPPMPLLTAQLGRLVFCGTHFGNAYLVTFIKLHCVCVALLVRQQPVKSL